ncbi:hypothetical protein G6F31_020739 [Rhizopus arrhizus]|nr:hypothetical protein G6F31_020739 [Rhizopus arrhizus]
MHTEVRAAPRGSNRCRCRLRAAPPDRRRWPRASRTAPASGPAGAGPGRTTRRFPGHPVRASARAPAAGSDRNAHGTRPRHQAHPPPTAPAG